MVPIKDENSNEKIQRILEDNRISQLFSFIGAGAKILGNVEIRKGVFIGANATCFPNINIGDWSTISMCSPVIKDIPDNVTVIGNPSKIMKIGH